MVTSKSIFSFGEKQKQIELLNVHRFLFKNYWSFVSGYLVTPLVEEIIAAHSNRRNLESNYVFISPYLILSYHAIVDCFYI